MQGDRMDPRWSITLLLLVAMSLPVAANDTLATLGAGGLVAVKSSEIAIASEDLEISAHQIKVRYVFRNGSDHDIDAIIAFPLPALDGGLIYNEPVVLPSNDPVNFVDFKVEANDARVTTKVETRALADDRDITAYLASLGLPASVVLEPLNSALMKLSIEQRGQLEKEGLIVPGEFNPPLHSVGRKGWWAGWAMQTQFYWTQHFPAKGKIELVQTYRPVVGGSYITADNDGAGSIKLYCASTDLLEKIKQSKSKYPAKQGTDAVLMERTIQYILKTGNNWNAPIASFQLS